jgi:hypothetical protein
MAIPAVVTAGDRGAARAVHGESKVYLEIDGRPLVAHVVEVLQQVPEVSEVWVIGDSERLAAALESPEERARRSKPLHLLEQHRNLYENAWESYRRLLPGAGPEGRDPLAEPDLDTWVLYLSGDLPFATPQEISAFVRRGLALDCDYATGLVTEESLQEFLPGGPDQPGIRMAAFNLREGRFRQSNLHLARPARLGNRHYIQAMYEQRHQLEWAPIVKLAWRLLSSERGGLRVVWYYALMHLAGLADRHGLRGLADFVRRFIPMARVERGCSDLLRTRFRMVVTEVGGCAVDIDTDHDYQVSRRRFAEWREAQARRAERLLGPPALPAGAAGTQGDVA